jgi:hypothetical protein
MSVMKALEVSEIVYTKEGRKRATHEAYCYSIVPYHNPPVKLEVVKGLIDKNGQFLALPTTVKAIEITPDEFRQLISPTPQGKPAGDFRLSDVLSLLKKRLQKAVEPPKDAAVAPAARDENPSASDVSPPVAAADGAPQAQAVKTEDVKPQPT